MDGRISVWRSSVGDHRRWLSGARLDPGFEDGPDRGWLPGGSRMTWLNTLRGERGTGSWSPPPGTT